MRDVSKCDECCQEQCENKSVIRREFNSQVSSMIIYSHVLSTNQSKAYAQHIRCGCPRLTSLPVSIGAGTSTIYQSMT